MADFKNMHVSRAASIVSNLYMFLYTLNLVLCSYDYLENIHNHMTVDPRLEYHVIAEARLVYHTAATR